MVGSTWSIPINFCQTWSKCEKFQYHLVWGITRCLIRDQTLSSKNSHLVKIEPQMKGKTTNCVCTLCTEVDIQLFSGEVDGLVMCTTLMKCECQACWFSPFGGQKFSINFSRWIVEAQMSNYIVLASFLKLSSQEVDSNAPQL